MIKNYKWIKTNDAADFYTLWFTPFYEELKLATLWYDYDEEYWIVTTTYDNNTDYLYDRKTLAECQLLIEEEYKEYYLGEMEYYKTLYTAFCENIL